MEINRSDAAALQKTNIDAATLTDSGKRTKKETVSQDKNSKADAYNVKLSKEAMENAKAVKNPEALGRAVFKDSVAALSAATHGLSEKSLELLA